MALNANYPVRNTFLFLRNQNCSVLGRLLQDKPIASSLIFQLCTVVALKLFQDVASIQTGGLLFKLDTKPSHIKKIALPLIFKGLLSTCHSSLTYAVAGGVLLNK